MSLVRMTADFHDASKAEARLRAAANRLHAMAGEVAQAKQVKEFASDRRKNLLARYMAPLLASGSGATAAEMVARANPEYQQELDEQAEQYAAAERVLSEHGATMATFDAARSLLSMSKESMRVMQG